MIGKSVAVAVIVFVGAAKHISAQETLLRQAARLDSEHNCAGAEQIYQQVLARGPASPAVLNNLGNHYLVCGNSERAREYFERLLQVNPAHPNANLQLARIAANRHDGARALQYLAHVKDSRPTTRMLHAEALHWAGKRAEAAAVMDGMQTESRADPRLTYLYAITCARIELYDRAVAAFNAVLALHPDDFDVLFNLGRAASRAKMYDRALSALSVAARLQPRSVETLTELAAVNAALGDYTRAVYLLVQAKQLAPGRPEIVLGLAHAAQIGEYYGDAALAYDEYLRLKPDDDSARRDRALVCGFTDTRQAEGLKEIESYVQKHPADPLGHYYLAQLTWRDHPQQAADALTTALKLDPRLAAAHLNLGWLLNREGKTADAIKHFERASELTPTDCRALDQLGAAYVAIDRAADAETVLRRAVALSPNDPEILMHLGRALMENGKAAEAREYLQKFKKVAPERVRGPWRQAAMIESAGLSPSERNRREIDRLRREASSHQDDPELQLRLASLLLAAGRAGEADSEFRVLLTRNAQSRVWQQGGAFLLSMGRYSLAREFLARAAAANPAANLDLATAVFYLEGPTTSLAVLEQVPAGQRSGDWLLLKAKILDAAGRAADSETVLEQGLEASVSRPRIAREAALLLVRHGRNEKALDFLNKAAHDDPDLQLTRAAVLALMNRFGSAEQSLKNIEALWPEWDRPYVVHGLLLEKQRPAEAKRKLETALGLGSTEPAATCALARLAATPAPDPKCACAKGLFELLFPACGNRPQAATAKE